MTIRRFPSPVTAPDWKTWALQLIETLENTPEVSQANNPAPVLLNHFQDSITHRPDPAGILMFDPATSQVLVSANYTWTPLNGEQTVTWDSIADKPEAFTPESHTHKWQQIKRRPSKFPPIHHTHTYADISGDLPAHEHYLSDIILPSGIDLSRLDYLVRSNEAVISAHLADTTNPHATTFLNLSDTDPTSYTGLDGYRAVVNASEDGIELEQNLLLTLDDFSDTTLTGKAGQVIKVNAGETAFELGAVSGSGGAAEAFHAYGSDGVGVQVYLTEDFANSNYSTLTGGYTAPSDGVYYFYAGFVADGGASAATAYLRKNSTRVLRNRRFGLTSVGNVPGHIAMVMSLSSGDVVDFETDVATPSPGVGEEWNYFGGYRIGD